MDVLPPVMTTNQISSRQRKSLTCFRSFYLLTDHHQHLLAVAKTSCASVFPQQTNLIILANGSEREHSRDASCNQWQTGFTASSKQMAVLLPVTTDFGALGSISEKENKSINQSSIHNE